MTDAEALLTRLFEAYNRRDFVACAALLQDDVNWPNQTRDGRLMGPAQIRDYWTRYEQMIRVEVSPLSFTSLPDGRTRVAVNQVVRNPAGALWSDTRVWHDYTLRDGKVVRLDISPFEESDTAP